MKMKLNDGTACINAVKWNCSNHLKINDLIDIAFKIELNNWKKLNILQLNIIDIKNFCNITELHVHDRIYKCQLMEDEEIVITNKKGMSISSDFSKNTKNIDNNESDFAQKILSFAEIALGKAA